MGEVNGALQTHRHQPAFLAAYSTETGQPDRYGGVFRRAPLCVGDLLSHTAELDKRIAEYDRAIAQAAKEDAHSKRLMKLPGIGPITASALLASIGGSHDFDSSRQVAAWIGLVPGHTAAAAGAR